MDAIDHLDLVVDDLDRSLAFYTGLLEPLGYHRTLGDRGRARRAGDLRRADGRPLRPRDPAFLHDPDGIELEIVHRPRQ